MSHNSPPNKWSDFYCYWQDSLHSKWQVLLGGQIFSFMPCRVDMTTDEGETWHGEMYYMGCLLYARFLSDQSRGAVEDIRIPYLMLE